jgi:uncharacterized membrane protein YbhN (UPF0104 family)
LLQAPVLTARQRSGLETTDLDLDALRDRVAAEAGCEVPELQKLHRITGRTLVQLALAVVAFMALSSAFSGIDLSLLVTQVREATWWLVVIGLLVAQLARVPAAASTQGASPQPIPLGPLYMLQLALAYIGLALPGSAARFAVNVRFLQRQGLPSGSAVAVSALDSVWWFVVQIVLLVGIIIATPLSLDVDLGGSSGGLVSRLLPIVGLIAVVAIVVLAAVPAWRRPIADWFRQMFHEARAAATGLSQPRRLGGLIGGNLALQILLALALAAFTRALGHPIGYVEVLFVNLSVSLLAGLLPVPGGIGLVEGALTVGLVRAGMPDESAFAAALLYRMATFYLPPIWGFFALRWLERRRFL